MIFKVQGSFCISSVILIYKKTNKVNAQYKMLTLEAVFSSQLILLLLNRWMLMQICLDKLLLFSLFVNLFGERIEHRTISGQWVYSCALLNQLVNKLL